MVDLDELRALYAKATPGEWARGGHVSLEQRRQAMGLLHAFPALVDEVEALRERVPKLERQVADLKETIVSHFSDEPIETVVPPKPPGDPVFSFRAPAALLDEVIRDAKRQGTTVSAVIRQAISDRGEHATLLGALCHIDIALDGDGERPTDAVVAAAEQWHAERLTMRAELEAARALRGALDAVRLCLESIAKHNIYCDEPSSMCVSQARGTAKEALGIVAGALAAYDRATGKRERCA